MNGLDCIAVKFEIAIDASVDLVWQSLVNDTAKWWGSDFYTNPKTKGFHIEGRLGGRTFEDYGDGEGLIWAEVIGVDAPNAIMMKGLLAPDFGGPAISYLSIKLLPDGSGTRFQLTDTLFGAVNDGTAAQIEAGWKTIYGEALKNYFESE